MREPCAVNILVLLSCSVFMNESVSPALSGGCSSLDGGDCCGSKICNEPYLLVTYMILLYVDTSCDLSMLFSLGCKGAGTISDEESSVDGKEKDCKSLGRMMDYDD